MHMGLHWTNGYNSMCLHNLSRHWWLQLTLLQATCMLTQMLIFSCDLIIIYSIMLPALEFSMSVTDDSYRHLSHWNYCSTSKEMSYYNICLNCEELLNKVTLSIATFIIPLKVSYFWFCKIIWTYNIICMYIYVHMYVCTYVRMYVCTRITKNLE